MVARIESREDAPTTTPIESNILPRGKEFLGTLERLLLSFICPFLTPAVKQPRFCKEIEGILGISRGILLIQLARVFVFLGGLSNSSKPLDPNWTQTS